VGGGGGGTGPGLWDPLAVYDISGTHAGAPVLQSTIFLNFPDHPEFDSPVSTWNLACDDQRAYFSGTTQTSPPQLRIFTVDLQSSSWSGGAGDFEDFNVALDPTVTHVEKYGQYLLVNNGLTKNMTGNDIHLRRAAGLSIIDVSNPASPVLAAQFTPYAWSNSGIRTMPGYPYVMASSYSADSGVRIFSLETMTAPTLAAYEDADMLHSVADLYSSTGWDPGILIYPYIYSAKLDHLEILDVSTVLGP